MNFIKLIAIIAIASVTLNLGACVNKNKKSQQPAPASIGTSK